MLSIALCLNVCTPAKKPASVPEILFLVLTSLSGLPPIVLTGTLALQLVTSWFAIRKATYIILPVCAVVEGLFLLCFIPPERPSKLSPDCMCWPDTGDQAMCRQTSGLPQLRSIATSWRRQGRLRPYRRGGQIAKPVSIRAPSDERDHLAALGHQAARHVRPDESGRAGHEGPP